MATSRLSLTLCCPIYSPRTRGRSDNSNVASSSIIDPAITRFDIFFSVGLSVPAAPFLRLRAIALALRVLRLRAIALALRVLRLRASALALRVGLALQAASPFRYRPVPRPLL